MTSKLRRASSLAFDIVQALPFLLRVRYLLWRYRNIYKVIGALHQPSHRSLSRKGSGHKDPSHKDSVSQHEQQRVVRGVRWLLRLLRVRPHGNCLPRSLIIFAMLRRRGYPVVFCSGVRYRNGKLEGHAWVELDGRVIEALHEPNNRRDYQLNIVYPTPLPPEPYSDERTVADIRCG